MPSIAREIPKSTTPQDGYVPIAPKTASTRARDGYVVIAPKSIAMTPKVQSFVNSSNSLPLSFPHNIKSYVTRSTRARAVSENIDSHFRHRKSPRGLGRAVLNERRLKSGSLGPKNIENLSLAPVRRDGYVQIAPKSNSTTSKSQDIGVLSSSLSPNLPAFYDSSITTCASSTHSAPDCIEAHSSFDVISENSNKAAIKKSFPKNEIYINDSTGAITSTLLARYHLPGILINHGPLAIRHIMSFLTAAVPGFSKISPTKSRRLVVSALERGVVEDGEGELKSDVIFEKVGWGRWNAKLNNRSGSGNQITAYPGSPSSCKSDSAISKKSKWYYDEIRLKASGNSLHDDSISYSHMDDVDIDMTGNESDKNFFDGQETCSSSDSIDEDEIMSDNSSDTTDDEDWAALGAAALRAASYSTSGTSNNYFSYLAHNEGCRSDSGVSASIFTKTCPRFFTTSGQNNPPCDMTPNSQEREAVEALMNLGST